MHLALHHSATRVIARAGLLALLAATALGLTQCVQVTDPISGATVATFAKEKTGKCFEQCAKKFSRALEAEEDLYKANKKACNHSDVCLALERARHDQAVDQIKADFKSCRQNCHHQGHGDGDDDEHGDH